MTEIRQHYFAFDPQPIRWLDVVFIGPLIIYAGVKGDFRPWIKTALVVTGVATIVYNGANYLENEKAKENGL